MPPACAARPKQAAIDRNYRTQQGVDAVRDFGQRDAFLRRVADFVLARMKIMAIGATCAMLCASRPAPLGRRRCDIEPTRQDLGMLNAEVEPTVLLRQPMRVFTTRHRLSSPRYWN